MIGGGGVRALGPHQGWERTWWGREMQMVQITARISLLRELYMSMDLPKCMESSLDG